MTYKTIKVGDKVVFSMPVEGVNTGVVSDIDGAYITVSVKIKGKVYPIERYPNEITVL